MRAEAANVNAATRIQRVQQRANIAPDWLHGTEHLPEVETEQEVVGLSEILRGDIELTTKTQSGSPAVIRVPYPILAVLVTIALAAIGAGFWVVSSVTEMKTNLAIIQQNQREQKAESTANMKLTIAYATNETNRINFLTGLLTQEQQQRLYRYDAANPRPPLPEVKDKEQ